MANAEADTDAQSLTSEEGIRHSKRVKHLTEKGAEFHAQLLRELLEDIRHYTYGLKGSLVKFATILRAFVAKIAYRIR